MSKKIDTQRDQVLLAMLPQVPRDGWTMMQARAACTQAGLAPDMVEALFPAGLDDVVSHFSDYLDRLMLDQLGKPTAKMRVRDRIEQAVMTRFECAEPYKDAMRLALAYWSVPPRTLRAGRIVWRTADRMWAFAGDTATDYNHYTKRGLLTGVLTTTTLVWLKDQNQDLATTRAFLANRIENVLHLGQIMGKFKPRQAS